MSGKPRHVIVRVDDPEVTHLDVFSLYGDDDTLTYDGDEAVRSLRRVPVPPDDQLVRDVDLLTGDLLHWNDDLTYDEAMALAARIRAAFGLDDGKGFRGMAEQRGLTLREPPGGQERIDSLTGTVDEGSDDE